MKKHFVFVSILFSLCAAAFCEEADNTDESLQPDYEFEQESENCCQSICDQLTYVLPFGIEGNTVLGSLSYSYVTEKLKLTPSVQVGRYAADATVEVLYFPDVFNKEKSGNLSSAEGKQWRFGIDLKYHNQLHYKTALENDVVLSAAFERKTPADFIFSVQTGLHVKESTIFALKDSRPVIFDIAYSLNLFASRKINDELELQLYALCNTTYRYSLFCSPTFGLASEYRLSDEISLGLAADVRSCDILTSAPYFDRASVSSSVRYTF